MIGRVLGPGDLEVAQRLCARDPVKHCFVASRLDLGVLSPGTPGELWGYPADEPRALLHVGANCVPVETDAEARAAFVEDLGAYRPFVSIVGQADEALALFEAVGARWGASYRRARAIRENQPLMAIDHPALVDADPRVKPVTMADFESYFDAAVAMYAEELGESPLLTNPVGYRAYVGGLVDTYRAFGLVEDGEVVFKADVGCLGGGVAQIQGVWVRPDRRGQGLAAPAMAALTNALVTSGFVASLYVNDFNAPAIATYLRCGYRIVDSFASVLY